MNRRFWQVLFISVPVSISVFLSALCSVAEAQQQARISTVGRLSQGHSSDPFTHSGLQAFQRGLRELGWVDGKNIRIESRWGEGRPDRLPELAAELVRLPVDVFVALGNQAIRAAKQTSTAIPIVMSVSTDPVALGFVTSLARPGGNITGLSWLGPELSGKRLELLKETVPQVARVAVLSNSASPAHNQLMKEIERAARDLGLMVRNYEARRPEDFEGTFRAMRDGGSHALLVQPEPLLIDPHRERIAVLAIKHRLPAIYPWGMFVDAGGLLSYGPDLLDLHRRSAGYVDKILKGVKPAVLPVQQPTKFELIINLKAAKQIGLTIPPNVLARADKVIK
jgi:putative tryptophan/tyrosine transport system substrate-binding protein